MLLTRRKRKEQTNVAVYLNNRAITQIQKLKYLGIVFDYKLTFRDHINYIEEKCTKLILGLVKPAKINWGLGHEALRTIYVGGILPLLCYICLLITGTYIISRYVYLVPILYC
jgi:hypothetical protein